MKKIINTTVDKLKMIDNNDIIVVGVSGGADSVALLHYLKFQLNIQVIVCNINHKLRGDESNRDMNFVNSLCTDWNIPCFIREIDVNLFAKENSMGIEEAGRFLRYSEFDFILQENNATKIATAHTLSDTAETMLLNLTRGAGLQGLCGIPAMRDNIIRPLIECTREQIEEYCLEHSLKYVNDSSNFSDDYSRNNIRNNIIPILKEINPAFMQSISRSVTLLNRDNDFIKKEVNDSLFFCNEISFGCYDIKTLPSRDVSIRSRVISNILERHNIKKSFYLINSIDKMIILGKGKEMVSTEKYIEIKNNELNIINSQDNIDYFENLLPKLNKYNRVNPYEFITPCGELLCFYTVNKENIVQNGKNDKNELYICLDYDKIEGSILIRQRKIGDKIEFSHRKGTKSLKKFFIDEKLTGLQKSKVLVFADDNGVLAVGNYGVSKNVVVDTNTNTILVIEKLLI